MAEIVVREAVGADDIAAVRRLLQAYGEYLAANPSGAANICIEGYAQELERLPAVLRFVAGNCRWSDGGLRGFATNSSRWACL
jgi:hypothetical protein